MGVGAGVGVKRKPARLEPLLHIEPLELDGATADLRAPAMSSAAALDFGAEVAAHQDRLFRVALLLTGDRHLAEDVLADVCAKVFEKWQAGLVDDPGAYLHRALVNEVTGRWWRRRVIRREQQRRRVVSDNPPPDGVVMDRATMLDALRSLPARQRAVLVLRFYEDRPESDVARILGMSLGTVKSTQSRALAALRARWPVGGDDG
jgi:RNA polymerase sigma-70 factor (sigma-E family)